MKKKIIIGTIVVCTVGGAIYAIKKLKDDYDDFFSNDFMSDYSYDEEDDTLKDE